MEAQQRKYYVVCGTVETVTDTGKLYRPIPTFYLSADSLGIVSAVHALEIAKTIVNPMNDPTIIFHGAACLAD